MMWFCITDQDGRHWEIGGIDEQFPTRTYKAAYLHGWRGSEKQILGYLRAGYTVTVRLSAPMA